MNRVAVLGLLLLDVCLCQYTNSSAQPALAFSNLNCGNFTLPGNNTSQSCMCSFCAAACHADVDIVGAVGVAGGLSMPLLYKVSDADSESGAASAASLSSTYGVGAVVLAAVVGLYLRAMWSRNE